MATTAGSNWTRFPKAPIKEAVLDLRAELPPTVRLDRLSTFQERIRERYPQKRERKHWEATLGFNEGGLQTPVSKGGIDGFLFSSSDGLNTVQARLDGFTFNRLHPYDRWETFRDEAKGLWEHYLQVATPTAVKRLALRYINRLELPLPFKDFKEYILTTPEISPALPQGLKTFFMRLEIPHESYQAVAIITETMEAPSSTLRLPVILDIDVIRETTVSPSSSEIWQVFEQLRDFKNEIFFNSITEKAKELFR
jgi:uncharacterized protein (TIGR04255 family)